jgi:hypothetical protein
VASPIADESQLALDDGTVANVVVVVVVVAAAAAAVVAAGDVDCTSDDRSTLPDLYQ